MLFSILQGPSSRIGMETTPLHEGWAYFTPDTKGFYIDAKVDGELQRIQINPDEVFQAVKNETTYAEIAAAANRGNTVLCVDGAAVCQLNSLNEGTKTALFISIYKVDSDNVAHIRAWNVTEGDDGTTTWTRHNNVTTEAIVDSVTEINHNAEQKFWRGTKEEYDALESKDESVLYIVTDEENNAVSGASVQSDWNENDETSVAYIQNRPFYSAVEEEFILPETELTFSSSQATIDADLPLEIGETYIVTWSGAEYSCVGQAFGQYGVSLGDMSSEGGIGNGEPFGIVAVYPEMQSSVSGIKTLVACLDSSSNATISIMGKIETIQQLDVKYIPDSVEANRKSGDTQTFSNAKLYADCKVANIVHPAEISIRNAIIGTTWENDAETGVKTQTVEVDGVSVSDTASIDCVYDGDYTSDSYAAFVEQKNQFLTHITNGFSETVDGGVKFTIFGETNTVEIPILVEAIHHSLPHIYGVSWDGTSTTKWTRTDDAATFADPMPYVSGASTYGSPFDNLYPWSGMKTSEHIVGTMVAIPKFWYKLTQNSSGGMDIQIADQAVNGFSVSPAHMDRGDGVGERDVVYIGRYHCGAGDYKSVTGVMPQASKPRSAFRRAIHNLGDTIWQNDFATRFTIWLLYLVEFADWNSQSTIGYGCSSDGSQANNGQTDNMPYHTGTTAESRTTYGWTQYRNIEGLWDNVYDWMDGGYNDTNGMNVILNPADFSDTTGGTLVGMPSSGLPSAFSVSSAGGFPAFIPSASSGGTSTYSCDCWYFSSSNPCWSVGGYYHQVQNRGLFFMNCDDASVADSGVGSRLLELPQ